MRQIAIPAAVGSCALGAASSPLRAAEWSLTPVYSSSVDWDSDRSLVVGGKGSGATVLAVDLKFKRALEDLEVTFEPRYAFRRFTDATLGNGDDRSVNGTIKWVGERSALNFLASYLDQSTLITELLETGLVSGDTHRRLGQVNASWNWNQTELRSLTAQLSYSDVSYYGQDASVLTGYRYPSASVGERFNFSERASLTLGTFGSRLESVTPGNSSHEVGIQAEITCSFSEKTNLDASIGESRRVLSGGSSHGTDASVYLNHSLFLGNVYLAYTRSLVPYGIGFLVDQQQFTATLSRPLTPVLDSSLSFFRVQNNETAVLLRLDRRNYNSLSASVSWHPVETWNLSARIEGLRTQLAAVSGTTIDAWRGSITLTWAPFPRSRSW
jgi:hypothetical protein